MLKYAFPITTKTGSLIHSAYEVNVADIDSMEFTFILVRRDMGKMSLQMKVLFENKKVLKYRVAKEITKRLTEK